ncbi:MAG: ATP-binding cassette domain-containing protein [Spirochaetales bacterium]|nr:ATP-binding cassette domain-containing protein [Spirochaetales bacterium]MCF7937064.1 ATP-binding cassette domain-containing protein [Spirochaetales bacterium]
MNFSPGSVHVIMGPSGCGKTSLLQLIAGLLPPDTGSIEGTAGCRVSYLFQEPRLLPWMSVEGNLDLVIRKVYPHEVRREKIDSILELVGLSEFRRYYPHALSGGMKQRVSLARAFIYPGSILLMDEPLKALDLDLRLSLVDVFRRLWLSARQLCVFVTHDLQEAVLLGDVITIFSRAPARVTGRLENPVKMQERYLGRSELLELEKKVYEYLVPANRPPGGGAADNRFPGDR